MACWLCVRFLNTLLTTFRIVAHGFRLSANGRPFARIILVASDGCDPNGICCSNTSLALAHSASGPTPRAVQPLTLSLGRSLPNSFTPPLALTVACFQKISAAGHNGPIPARPLTPPRRPSVAANSVTPKTLASTSLPLKLLPSPRFILVLRWVSAACVGHLHPTFSPAARPATSA